TSTSLKTSLPSNHPNAELSLARAHHRCCAREGVDSTMHSLQTSLQCGRRSSGSFQAIDELGTLISYIVLCGLPHGRNESQPVWFKLKLKSAKGSNVTNRQ